MNFTLNTLLNKVLFLFWNTQCLKGERHKESVYLFVGARGIQRRRPEGSSPYGWDGQNFDEHLSVKSVVEAIQLNGCYLFLMVPTAAFPCRVEPRRAIRCSGKAPFLSLVRVLSLIHVLYLVHFLSLVLLFSLISWIICLPSLCRPTGPGSLVSESRPMVSGGPELLGPLPHLPKQSKLWSG